MSDGIPAWMLDQRRMVPHYYLNRSSAMQNLAEEAAPQKKYALTIDIRVHNVTENKEYQQVLVVQKELDYAGLVMLQERITMALGGMMVQLGKEAVELKKQRA